MIEIPESNAIARQINERPVGKKIFSVCAGKSPHKFAIFTGETGDYPGLGNGTLQDILFHAKVNPKSRISKLEMEKTMPTVRRRD